MGAAFLLDPGPVLQTKGVPDPVSYPNHKHSPRVLLRLDTRSTREQASRAPKPRVCPAADQGTRPPFWPLPKPQRARNIAFTDTLAHLDSGEGTLALPDRSSTPLALAPSHRGTGIDLVTGVEGRLGSRIGGGELAAGLAPKAGPPIWGLPRVSASGPAGSPPRSIQPLVLLDPMPFHLCPNFDLGTGEESLLDSRIGEGELTTEITPDGRSPLGGPPRVSMSGPAGSPLPSTSGTSGSVEMLLGLLGGEGGPCTGVSQRSLPSFGGSPPGLGPGPAGPSPPSLLFLVRDP